MKLSFHTPTVSHRLIRLPEVQRLTGLGRSQLYALASQNEFPKPLKLSQRCSAWVEADVHAWIAHRVERARRNAGCSSNEEA
jgi:prophage regulatory protein